MPDLKIYNPDEITIVFGPVVIDSGFADDEFITIEPESDDFEDTVGVDGTVTRTRTGDRRATVTIMLKQTADANDLLSAIRNADINSPGAAGVNPILISDQNGRAVFSGEHAWIMAPPAVSFGRTPTDRSWQFRVANLKRVDGGNTGP